MVSIVLIAVSKVL